jgi:hypothetical protein
MAYDQPEWPDFFRARSFQCKGDIGFIPSSSSGVKLCCKTPNYSQL